MLCALPSVGSNREARVASTPSTLQFFVPKKKKKNNVNRYNDVPEFCVFLS